MLGTLTTNLLSTSTYSNHTTHGKGGTMSVPFERYEEEFDSLVGQVQSHLSRIHGSTSSGGDLERQQQSTIDKEEILSRALGLLSQLNDLVQQMTIEARSVSNDPNSSKEERMKKLRVCKARRDNIRDDCDSARKAIERESLLSQSNGHSSSRSSNGSNSDAVRANLLSTNEKLSSQNETLDRARRIMSETEEVAFEISEELGRNRERIDGVHNRVKDVGGLTNRARRLLQNMQRREIQQKIVVGSVILLLLIVVVLIFVKK